MESLGDTLGDNPDDKLTDSLGDTLGDNPEDKLMGNLCDSLGESPEDCGGTVCTATFCFFWSIFTIKCASIVSPQAITYNVAHSFPFPIR